LRLGEIEQQSVPENAVEFRIQFFIKKSNGFAGDCGDVPWSSAQNDRGDLELDQRRLAR
jgi:hypothetical protein